MAAMQGHGDIVSVLLQAGANPRLADGAGRDAMQNCQYYGQREVIPVVHDWLAEHPVVYKTEDPLSWKTQSHRVAGDRVRRKARPDVVPASNVFGVTGLKVAAQSEPALNDVMDKLSNMVLKRDAEDAFEDLEEAFSNMKMKKKRAETAD